jgi:hypothetical protein
VISKLNSVAGWRGQELANVSRSASGAGGSGPAVAHRRQIKGLRLPGENLSRLVRRSLKAAFRLELCRGEGGRDSVKVAQYEVLG